MKFCTKCNQEKNVQFFSKSKRSKDGLQSWCKECSNAARAKWNQENPEKRAAANKSWEERNQNKVREKSLKWRNQNIERARENARNWKKNNPDRHARIEQKRRALKALADIGDFPSLTELIEVYGSACMYPGCTDTNLTVDHVIPLSLGGSHDATNAQILCKFHNSQKGNRNSNDYRPTD